MSPRPFVFDEGTVLIAVIVLLCVIIVGNAAYHQGVHVALPLLSPLIGGAIAIVAARHR